MSLVLAALKTKQTLFVAIVAQFVQVVVEQTPTECYLPMIESDGKYEKKL